MKDEQVQQQKGSAVHLVVQRYRSCRILLDEREWVTVGQPRPRQEENTTSKQQEQQQEQQQPPHCGMLLYVSFSQTTTKAAICRAVHTILAAPVLTTGQWGDGVSSTCSLLQLTAKHKTTYCCSCCCSLVIVPQANLISKIRQNNGSIQYHGQISKNQGRQLFEYFVTYTKGVLLEEQCRQRSESLPANYTVWKQQQQQQLGGDTNDDNTSKQQQQQQHVAADPSIPPKDYFRTALYATWDHEGLPLTTANGTALTHSATKKCRKLQAAQTKRHTKWKQKQLQQQQQQQQASQTTNAQSRLPTVKNETQKEQQQTTASSPPPDTSTVSLDNTSWTTTALDDTFCHVVAASFGKRQGLELFSDMGPFCHVWQF